MRATFISPNKYIMKVYSTIYLMILIMHYKYLYILIYIWSKFKAFDFSGRENDIYFGTERVYGHEAILGCLYTLTHTSMEECRCNIIDFLSALKCVLAI
jgi:hypothetical protein